MHIVIIDAAIGDISHPNWWGSSLGVIADTYGGLEAGFWFTAAAMTLSGMWVAFAMDETLARINPQDDDWPGRLQ